MPKKSQHLTLVTPTERVFEKEYVDEDIFQRVLERMGNGEYLQQILKEEGLPSFYVFGHWTRHSEEHMRRYILAREIQADALIDESLYISDTDDSFKAQRRIYARQWVASRVSPKVYSQKVEQSQTISIKRNGIDFSALDEDARNHLRSILESAMATKVIDARASEE